MEAVLLGLINRSTASGWILCILAMGGIIRLGQIVALQRPKMRELDISEDAGIRAFMAEQMDGLRVEIKTLRDENKSLRDEVRDLHGIIDGMRREALQAGISTQRAVVDTLPRDLVPEKTREALDRIKGTGE